MIKSKYFDVNEDGFSIRCKLYYDKDPRSFSHVVIATCGFGGDKDNRATEKFAARIISRYKGYGVICFDWPSHGKDALNRLTVDACLTYLELVTRYARDAFQPQDIFNYSSSLGAYVTLRYLSEKNKNPWKRIAFRCAALNIYQSMSASITEDEWAKLNKGKEIIRGFHRKIKISKEFLEDLKAHDMSQGDFLAYADAIFMVHGTKDEMAPFTEAEAFSENNVIELYPVENADHAFSNPDYMDLAIDKIIEFLKPA